MAMNLSNALALLLICTASSLQFTTKISYDMAQCFGEFITQSTPFHFRVQGSEGEYSISMHLHDGQELINNARIQRTKKIDSYASVTGRYNFCIYNSGDGDTFTVKFYQGLELSDLAALPSQQSSKFIDLFVDKLNELYQVVKEQQNYSRMVNQYNMELQKLVSFKSVGFGFLSITVVLIISFLHYLEIKRVLKNRKII